MYVDHLGLLLNLGTAGTQDLSCEQSTSWEVLGSLARERGSLAMRVRWEVFEPYMRIRYMSAAPADIARAAAGSLVP